MENETSNTQKTAIKNMASNLLLCDVPALMKQYFANKDEKKKIKIERQEYMTNHKCEGEDCIRDGTEEVDYCDVCKQRQNFYLRLKKLSGANTGIMLKVRSAVGRHIA